jgi:hypothetical protein
MYAEGTGVSVERSKAEIERTIQGYAPGAPVMSVSDPLKGRSGVQFRANGRGVQIGFDHPTGTERFITHTGKNQKRSASQIEERVQAEMRRRWRCVLLAVKTAFEMSETGIASFDEAFLPWLIGPDGRTVAETVIPQVERAIEEGTAIQGLQWGAPQLTAGGPDDG